MRNGMFVFCVLLSGCVTTPTFVPTTRFVLEPAADYPPAERVPLRLAVRPVEAGRPYRQQMLYRENGARLLHYEHAEWAEMPSETLTRVLIDTVRGSGRFSDVGLIFDVGIPDLLLIARVRRLEEDRSKNPAVAVCEMSFELRRAPERQAVWTAVFSAEEPISTQHDPAASAAAMSVATGKIVSEAVRKIAEIPLDTISKR